MARLCVYGDESGNFDFSRGPKASLYFILTTVVLEDHAIATDLLNLRRELTWQGHDFWQCFHATEEKQAVRDQVFQVLMAHEFRIHATILHKPKTQAHLRNDPMRFYKTAWYFHMRAIAPRIASANDELLVVASSIGTAKKRAAFLAGIDDVMKQVTPTRVMRSAFWPASIDPSLQVADYCCWAIQRKWENNDTRSYDLIKDKIQAEYDLFAPGTTLYY